MAAGRQNFSRKSYSNRSNEETCSYRNRIGQRISAASLDGSGGRISEHRRNVFINDDCGQSMHVIDHKLQGRNMEVESGLNSGPTKKRKFSPIVWDRVEKLVRVSSNVRVVSTSSVESDITCSSSTKLVKDFGRIERCSVSAENINNSSVESGEFKQEGSERNDEVSSLSTEDGHSLAPSIEDPENIDYKTASANMGCLSSESDSDHEDMLCTGLGMIPSCRNVFEFERLGKISEGTYGVVHKARDLKTGDIVALKKVKTGKETEGFPITALREINILGMLQHPSLVQMKEVVMDDFNGVYMVMEYVDHELKGYMERMKYPFSQSEVKRLMIQLLEAVSYLQDNYVMHRDLKTSNLLLNKDGELKICDFGMARQYASPLKPYTSLVVTLWYRAPELLLGMKSYSTAVDMWSVGCIMAELLSKKPLFDGSKEIEQIDKIFRTLGTPNDLIWPGYSKLPGVKSNFVKQPYNCLRKKFPVATFTGSPALTELGFDLLNKFLTYDPEKRITAKEALNHGWFCESPLPAEHVRIRK
ncbi:hypothetical protein E3N88_39453 [Mikania micrantha]|uniref:cyclin-dependent kinase n=1 Tax=Mikania micrantha TaxID=192012 RepID=A0A5N6LWU1_9ASTR|nr:hypothetical protein E3N88_39453 [Mikania micrantha]